MASLQELVVRVLVVAVLQLAVLQLVAQTADPRVTVVRLLERVERASLLELRRPRVEAAPIPLLVVALVVALVPRNAG